MKKLFTILMFMIVWMKSPAQVNYVLNPSLEQYSKCPTGEDQIKNAIFWSAIDTMSNDPLCSPEYCNKCAAPYTGVSVPAGFCFRHYPRTGDGMAQLEMFWDEEGPGPPYYRDYLQGRLYKPLTAGKTYCVTFYVTLEQCSLYAVSHIGAYLDDGSIDATQDSVSCASPQMGYSPQIFETDIINDTINWVKVQRSFIANGTEKFITIGNFFDKAHMSFVQTVPVPVYSGLSWYLVDDVSVIESNVAADAGPDKAISKGDTVTIGTDEQGMPCTWYKLDSIKPIGYSGDIKVHPDTTTSYVIEMDLCGYLTRDTVTITVWPASVTNLNAHPLLITPNPVQNDFEVGYNLTGEAILQVTDIMGRTMIMKKLDWEKQKATINAHDLAPGFYLCKIVQDGLVLSTGKLVKQ